MSKSEMIGNSGLFTLISVIFFFLYVFEIVSFEFVLLMILIQGFLYIGHQIMQKECKCKKLGDKTGW